MLGELLVKQSDLLGGEGLVEAKISAKGGIEPVRNVGKE